MTKILSKGWVVTTSGAIFLLLLFVLPFRHDILNSFGLFVTNIYKIYGLSIILLFLTFLFLIVSLFSFIKKKLKERILETAKQRSWKLIGLTLLFVIVFDIILFQTVTEAISKSDNAVILAILALIFSEEKLLQNFIVLNDKEVNENKAILFKKISVITITSLIVISSSTALVQTGLKYFNVPLQIFATMIIVMALQIIILAIISKYITNPRKNYTESFIYKFFTN